MISSAVRSAFGKLGKESVTVEVNTQSRSLNIWLFCTGQDREMCMLVTVVPFEECGVVTFSQVLQHPRALCPNTHPKVTAVLCCGPSSPVGVFDYFFKWIWIITADCP